MDMLRSPDWNLTAKTQLLAVIGDPIGHSMSPKMHNAALRNQGLDYIYMAFRVDRGHLSKAVSGFRSLGIRGINVTIPHKVEIMKFLDEIEETAKKIGAVNTIINDNGHLTGRNTDGEGAIKAINHHTPALKGKKPITLGAGGAAKSIAFYLCQEIEELTIVKRDHNFGQAKNLADSLAQHSQIPIKTMKLSSPHELKSICKDIDLIINTTPVGMHPNEGHSPLPGDYIHPHHFVFDVVYNPLETELLRQARLKGCQTLSGIEMLVNQGAIAYELWTGKFPDTGIMKQAILEATGGKKDV